MDARVDDTDWRGCGNGSGVIVRPSGIAGAGYGLVTQRSFLAGSALTWYEGREVSEQQARELKDGGLDSHLVRVAGDFIDGIKDPYPGCGGGSFANSALTVGGANVTYGVPRGAPKVDGCNVRGRSLVYLVAKSDIACGVEVLAFYGSGRAKEFKRDIARRQELMQRREWKVRRIIEDDALHPRKPAYRVEVQDEDTGEVSVDWYHEMSLDCPDVLLEYLRVKLVGPAGRLDDASLQVQAGESARTKVEKRLNGLHTPTAGSAAAEQAFRDLQAKLHAQLQKETAAVEDALRMERSARLEVDSIQEKIDLFTLQRHQQLWRVAIEARVERARRAAVRASRDSPSVIADAATAIVQEGVDGEHSFLGCLMSSLPPMDHQAIYRACDVALDVMWDVGYQHYASTRDMQRLRDMFATAPPNIDDPTE